MKDNYPPGMHTAEHILNQVMVRRLESGRCFSSHIEKKKSKCDYHFPRNLTETETREIEKMVNEVIAMDLPVTEEYTDRATAGERYNLSRLPEDSGDRIRVVRVGDFDACPCIGPHVSRTSEIGGFRLISASWNDQVLRLRFKIGTPAS